MKLQQLCAKDLYATKHQISIQTESIIKFNHNTTERYKFVSILTFALSAELNRVDNRFGHV